MKLRVWKWYHNWGDDFATSLWPTEAAAWQAIHHYVEQQWEEGLMDDEEFTGDREADIQKYFEWHEDSEWYSLDFQEVDFPDLNLADDEVLLTSNECAMVIAALDVVPTDMIAEHVGISEKRASEWVDSAYNKLKD